MRAAAERVIVGQTVSEPSSDVAFSRVIFGSGVVFALLGLAYFRLFGQRAKAVVGRVAARIFPVASGAFVGVALTFDLPLVAKVLLWIPAAVMVLAVSLGQVATWRIRAALKAKRGRRVAEPAVADGRAPGSQRSLSHPLLNGSIVGQTERAMDEGEARKLLEERLIAYRSRRYAELAQNVGSTNASQTVGPSGMEYNVEVMVLWDSPGKSTNVRVMAAVDDGRFPRAFVPLSDGFIMAPDGTFVGEPDPDA